MSRTTSLLLGAMKVLDVLTESETEDEPINDSWVSQSEPNVAPSSKNNETDMLTWFGSQSGTL